MASGDFYFEHNLGEVEGDIEQLVWTLTGEILKVLNR